MKNIKLIIISIVLAAFLAPFVFAEDIIIDEVVIKGNSGVETKEISDKISTGAGLVYSKYRIKEDIRNLYKTGKFEDIIVSLDEKDGKSIVTFEVVEKPKIAKLIIKGNKDVGEGDIKAKLEEKKETKESGTAPEEEKAPEQIAVKENEFFDEFMLKKAIIKVEDMYKERNFNYATVTYTIADSEEKKNEKGKWINVTLDVAEGDKMKVKKIESEGNKVFGIDKIKGIMKIKEEGWFQSGVFNENQFIEDVKAVLQNYYDEGYVKAKINGMTYGEIEVNKASIIKQDVTIDREKKEIYIKLPVEEGIKYTIKDIAVTGNEVYTLEELTDKMESKKDRAFNKSQFDRDIAALRALYSEKGHIFAQMEDSYVYDDEIGTVSVKVAITEGAVAYINEIKIRGNYVTKDRVIERELTVAAGEPFDSNKIKKTQERIYNLGFFDNIIIDTEQVDIDRLNLIFEVVERKTGTIGLGAGYSSLEGLVGYVQLSQSNLFGEGKAFSADVQFGNQKKSWQLSYKDPWIFDLPVSFGIDIWNVYRNKYYNNQGYDLDTYGFNTTFGQRITDEQKAYITYRYQEDRYFNITEEMKPYVDEGKRQISSITPMYLYDSRDDVFDPSRGFYTNASIQIGGGLLGGDYNYMKGLVDVRYFVPSWWKFVWAFHARVGNAWVYDWSYGRGIVPPTERFYCGGTDTVRGYEERDLGPVGGGNFLVVTNLEYKLKLIDKTLTLAAFFDSGNSWENISEVDWTNPYLYPSVGGGIRLTIPGTVMMIRIDYGYGLVPGARTEGGKLHFNVGNIF